MSVYRREYEPYAGTLTRERLRFLVLTRYALSEILASRAVLTFLFVTCVPVLASALIIYLAHNPAARALIGLIQVTGFLQIDAGFYRTFLANQCFFGLILSAWVGPRLISSDLANGALPLYLSRPLSRLEYVAGKALVLVTLLSCITWLPGLLLYVLNAIAADSSWAISHIRIAVALVVAGLSWTIAILLFVLSLSTWIRWNLATSAALFGIYFVSAGLGEALTLALRVSWGRAVSLGHLFEVLFGSLFGTRLPDGSVSALSALLVLGVLCCVSILVIYQRLRAREVVQ